MRVFLSWSGDSKPIAEALHDWLPDVLHSLDPWFSPQDIDLGSQSMKELEDALASTNFGIVCVTPNNANSNWLNYEAGALTKGLSSSRVAPLLIGLRPTELRGPLANAQSATATKEGVRRLLYSLNGALSERGLQRDRLDRQFDRCWPDLEGRLREVEMALGAPSEGDVPSTASVLDGLFTTTKQIHEDVSQTRQLMADLTAERLIEMVTGITLAQSPSRSGIAKLADRSSFPPLERQLADADELCVIGKSLEFMTGDNRETLERFVSRGGVMRCVVMNSNDQQLMNVASRSLHTDPSNTDLYLDIINSVARLRELRSLAGSDRDRVQVRSVDYVPPFALTMFTRPAESSSVIVELYPFRVTAARRPHLYVEQSSGLFGFFTRQFDLVWHSGHAISVIEEGS